MKRTALSVLLIAVLLFAAACSPVYEDAVNFAMGAAVTQKIYGAGKDCADAALESIKALEEEISYRKEGALAYFNAGGTLSSGDAYELILQSDELRRLTGGAYDITVLPLVRVWGFDTDLPALPSEEEIALALEKVGGENIIIDENGASIVNGAQADLSAAGKGAACRKAIETYKAYGASGGIVTVGGSVGVFGAKRSKKFTVAVRDPFDKTSFLALLTLTDCYISTSGSYEKQFTADGVNYHHLLDPVTGYPVQNGLVSVTVVCFDGALSDMLSSACFCMGEEKSISVLGRYLAQAMFVYSNGDIRITRGMEEYIDCEKYEVIP